MTGVRIRQYRPGRVERRDQRRFRTVTVAGAVFVAGALVPVAIAGHYRQSSDVDRPSAEPVARSATSYLMDVDTHGVIVQDERAGAIRGINASGETVWSDKTAYDQGADVSCGGACPQAVVSTSVASLTSPGEPDPAPRTLGRSPLPFAADVKTHVLAVSADDASVAAVAGADGQGWLETRAGDRVTARMPLPSTTTVWAPTSDDSAAVAITDTADPNRFEIRTFHHGPRGWVADPSVIKSTSAFGCTNGGGSVIVADPSPNLIGPSGEPRSIAGLTAGGDCAFFGNGAVVAQYSLSTDGSASNVAAIDATGAVRWQDHFTTEARIRADLHRERFVVIADGSAVEHRPDGTVSRTIGDAEDARYDEQGTLVVYHSDGKLQRLSS